MEGKMPNSDPDLGPPLKKARYQWQVKGQMKLKENDGQLKSSQKDDARTENPKSDEKDISFSPERTLTQNNAIPEFVNKTAQKKLDENDSNVQSFQKQTTECLEDHEKHSSIPVDSHLLTHGFPINDHLPICSGGESHAKCITKPQTTSLEILQDAHIQHVCSPIEIISSNENTCYSCSSVTAVGSSSNNSNIETPSSEKKIDSLAATIEPFNNSDFIRDDDVLNVNHDHSGKPEPGTSTGNVHENTGSGITPDILALESSNTNFVDLIQTKVDIQARKLNLLNMVQSNRQDDTVTENNTPSITNSTMSLLLSHSQTSTGSLPTDVPPMCTTCMFSQDMTDHATNHEQPDSVPQNSPPQPNSDTANSPNPSEDETFLCRWQSQHTAKAIVDNAINKTLEEMGLTPDVSTSAWNRLFLEDEGISEAIRLRGLWLRENNLQSHTIHPLITQITGASEQVFERSLNMAAQTFRPVQREIVIRNWSSNEEQATALIPVELDVTESNVYEQSASDGACSSDSEEHNESVHHDVSLESALAATDDVLQYAVSAAITSKGLSFQKNQSL